MTTNPTPTQQETLEPPERIWVDVRSLLSWGSGFWNPRKGEGDVEYLRADLGSQRGEEIVERVASAYPHFLTAVNPLAIQMLIAAIDHREANEDPHPGYDCAGTCVIHSGQFAATSSPAPAEPIGACSCCDHPSGYLPAVLENGKWLHQGRDSVEPCTATPRQCGHCGKEKTSPECWNCGLFDDAAPAERTRVEGEQEDTMEDYELDRNLKYTCPKCGGLWKAVADAEQCHGMKPCTKETNCAALSHFGDCKSMPTATSASDSARRAAEEVLGALWMVHALKTSPTQAREDEVAAIISKHFAAAHADNDAECQRCGKTGGKVVSFTYGCIATSRWVCPHCLDATDGTTTRGDR